MIQRPASGQSGREKVRNKNRTKRERGRSFHLKKVCVCVDTPPLGLGRNQYKKADDHQQTYAISIIEYSRQISSRSHIAAMLTP